MEPSIGSHFSQKSVIKEGSPYWVDRMCTFCQKVHNLQRENDSVTPRGGAQSLRFFFVEHMWTPRKSQKFFEYGRTSGTSIT